MAKVLSLATLADTILRIVSKPGCILFAGAGVGKRAGLPDWPQYLEHLASVAERYEPPTAGLMRARVKARLLTHAAAYYKQCPVIPSGEQWRELVAPFAKDKYNAERLRALMALPFKAAVTTNFDRSLHDAYAAAHGVSAVGAELGDPSLRQAIYNWQDFYIARIHGRAEVPQSIVIDLNDYVRTENDPDYIDFLCQTLTRTLCLFIGYSFVDPAISRILDVVDQRIGPTFPVLHTALLPSDAAELVARLAKYNIEVCLYPAEDDHEVLWKAIRQALTLYHQGPPKKDPAYPEPLEPARRLLASCYARLRMADAVQPLRWVVIEGIMLGLLAELGQATNAQLVEGLRRLIPLTEAESARLISLSVEGPLARGWIQSDGETIGLARPLENRLEQELEILVRGALTRLLVREGHRASGRDREVIRRVIEDLVLLRGWDLGASFASAKKSDSFDIWPIIRSSLTRLAPDLAEPLRERLAGACVDLFRRPEQAEAKILANLGRLAFGIEIALERGRSSLVQSATLPENVYLDANVLMPAIVEGHPYGPAYLSALKKLREAGTHAGVESRILALDVFLNEIVTHRNNAANIVKEYELEDPERLMRYITYVGAENSNVFVGGYASHVGRAKLKLGFGEFLQTYAPYRTEEELAAYLGGVGVEATGSDKSGPEEQEAHAGILTALRIAYQRDSSWLYDVKPDVLIKHEAVQLARLQMDLKNGRRSIFVTADSKLRRLAVGEILGRVGGCMVSHVGFVQLIDLLVGLEADPDSLTRVLWAVEAWDEHAHLRGYFVDVGLRHYDDAMARAMPRIIDDFIEEVKRASREERIPLHPYEAKEGASRTFKFMDRFEERFFERMAGEIRRREGERPS